MINLKDFSQNIINRSRIIYQSGPAALRRKFGTVAVWTRRRRQTIIRAALTGAGLALTAAIALLLWRRSPLFRATLQELGAAALALPASILRRSRAIAVDLRPARLPVRQAVTTGRMPRIEVLPAEEIPASPMHNGQL